MVPFVKTTPQMTRFRDGKVCSNLATDELTITEYSLTTSAEVDYKIQKEKTLYLVLRLRGETEHDTNDNVTTKIQTDFHTKHMNLFTRHEHVFSPFVCLVLFCLRQHIHELHTTSHGSSFTCARHLMVIT